MTYVRIHACMPVYILIYCLEALEISKAHMKVTYLVLKL